MTNVFVVLLILLTLAFWGIGVALFFVSVSLKYLALVYIFGIIVSCMLGGGLLRSFMWPFLMFQAVGDVK